MQRGEGEQGQWLWDCGNGGGAGPKTVERHSSSCPGVTELIWRHSCPGLSPLFCTSHGGLGSVLPEHCSQAHLAVCCGSGVPRSAPHHSTGLWICKLRGLLGFRSALRHRAPGLHSCDSSVRPSSCENRSCPGWQGLCLVGESTEQTRTHWGSGEAERAPAAMSLAAGRGTSRRGTGEGTAPPGRDPRACPLCERELQRAGRPRLEGKFSGRGNHWPGHACETGGHKGNSGHQG